MTDSCDTTDSNDTNFGVHSISAISIRTLRRVFMHADRQRRDRLIIDRRNPNLTPLKKHVF